MVIAATTVNDIIKRAIISFCYIAPKKITDKLKIGDLGPRPDLVTLCILMVKLECTIQMRLPDRDLIAQCGDDMGLINGQDYDTSFNLTMEGKRKLMSVMTVGHLKKLLAAKLQEMSA